MKIKDTMIFSNNGYITGEATYSLELHNIINNTTYTFTYTETVTNDRYLTFIFDSSALDKGTYKGVLTVNDNVFYTFVAQKGLKAETKYINDVKKEKYTYEVN